MPEKQGKRCSEIQCPIVSRRKYTPEIIQTHQSKLLSFFSENICSLTDGDKEFFYNFWNSHLSDSSQKNPRTYRLGIEIQYSDPLVNPHPYIETNHNLLEILSDFIKRKIF